MLSLSPLQAGSLFGVYFILVAIISYVLGKKIHTLRDYFLANQKLGVLPIAFSFATDTGLNGTQRFWNMIMPLEAYPA